MTAKKGDSALIIAAIFIVALVFLVSMIAVATPIVLLIVLSYYTYKSDSVKRTLAGDMSDFWLNESEKSEYKQTLTEYQHADHLIQEANSLGKSEGVSRNKDGTFSARSKLGKKLRSTIERYQPNRTASLDYLILISELPISRWSEFNDNLKKRFASIFAILAWVSTLIYYSVKLGVESVRDVLSAYIAMASNPFRGSENQLPTAAGDWDMIIISSLVAIISYFLFKFIFRNPASTFTPKPETVSMENIDSY
ncbi:hypothetical protein [Arenicella xantha]|uniref:Uncharacterized protein n=1 Tax=Arenicella xantha TaxID=644221 RepID=A0A395JR93_9GAMM|nr:hypothetical protein [Arenicella xantha]RBP52976.1 hypothetical protein DFR28_101360 [Arenicella xantha]